MSAKGVISLGFKVEDLGGGFKQLIMDADGFRKVIGATFKASQAFSKRVVV